MTAARRSAALVLLAFIAFISLGLPDGILGVAWPSARAEMGQPVSRLGLLLACGTVAYLIVSSLSGPIARRMGVGWLLVLSTLLAGSGLLLFALAPGWWWLLPAAFLGGLGAGGIDAGLNAFAAERFSPRVMSWLHACYGIGATLGPLLMTAVFIAGASWRWGYAIVAGAMITLACVFVATRRLWQPSDPSDARPPQPRATLARTLRMPLVWTHMALLLMYCGVEAGAGQLAYTLMTEGRGIPPDVAGPVVGGYWAALTIGRILFGQLAARWSTGTILRLGTSVAPMAIAVFWWNPAPWASFVALWALGLALAPIFPMMISLTPQRLGSSHGSNAVGVQISAGAIGIALLPGLGALLMREVGLESLGPYLFALAICVLSLDGLARRMAGPGRLA